MTRTPTRALGAALLAAALAAGACGGDDGGDATSATDEAPALTGVERDPAPDVSTVALPEAGAGGGGGGEPFTMQAEAGNLLLVYFGYTNCPDVCPTTMADVRAARDEVGADADRVDLAMVTIDPARDTGDLLSGYVQSFVEDAHALRTEDDAQLRSAADAFGADYSVSTSASGEVEVGHTGSLYAVDDAGKVLLEWPFGTSPDDMATDLEILLGRVTQSS